jgi:hypothetical protein
MNVAQPQSERRPVDVAQPANRWSSEHEQSGADNGEPPSAELRRQASWMMLIIKQWQMRSEADGADDELRECAAHIMTLSLEVETLESRVRLLENELAEARRASGEGRHATSFGFAAKAG